MNHKKFQKFIDRDKHCWHCGIDDETLIPQHRSNRGFGGGGNDSPSNIIVLCATANGLLESDAAFARQGVKYGWKLSRWSDSTTEPVFDAYKGVWAYLDDNYGRWDTQNLR